jgi:hypothetical protein
LTNQQLYLSIGIPSILVILAWLSNAAFFWFLNSKIDRHYENFNNQVTTLLNTIHSVDVRVVKLEGHK